SGIRPKSFYRTTINGLTTQERVMMMSSLMFLLIAFSLLCVHSCPGRSALFWGILEEKTMKKYFRFDELGTNYRQEFMAGMTTFLAMAYILFVNPATLALVGVEELPEGVTRIDQGAVFTATAVAAALGTLIMGVLAKYPIALAPGMGLNAFFSYTVILGFGIPWETALAGVLASGLIFIILTLTG